MNYSAICPKKMTRHPEKALQYRIGSFRPCVVHLGCLEKVSAAAASAATQLLVMRLQFLKTLCSCHKNFVELTFLVQRLDFTQNCQFNPFFVTDTLIPKLTMHSEGPISPALVEDDENFVKEETDFSESSAHTECGIGYSCHSTV